MGALVFLIASCGPKPSTIKDYVKNSDSASIAFYQMGKDSNTQIVIKDKVSIEKLGNYINGKPMDPQKCTDNGSIWFYEGGKKKMQVDFSLNGDCNYFSYMMNDKIYAKTMGEEASKYLTGIMEIATDSL